MSAFFDVVKALFLPFTVAAAIYFLLAYLLVPLVRTHRQRYSQYLPLDTLSQRTSSFRVRVGDALARFVLPRSMRWQRDLLDGRRESSDEPLAFGEEEGESMVGFDVERRDAMVRGGVVHAVEMDSQRRLSRELEEGFKDESEEEGEGDGGVDDRRR